MADTEAKCPHCGAALQPGSQFCGECGKAISAAGTEPSPAEAPAKPAAAPENAKQPNLARTMLGFDASQLLRAAAAQPAPPKPPGARGTPSGAFSAQIPPQSSKDAAAKPEPTAPAQAGPQFPKAPSAFVPAPAAEDA
ncbi:MAG TPA: zinc ribbon domain-containing protein, partial [Polyangiales bacterium]|nr:zinc ribbon domain-containing protein [Polyangiales bacterium]